jgi:hypothetical protein
MNRGENYKIQSFNYCPHFHPRGTIKWFFKKMHLVLSNSLASQKYDKPNSSIFYCPKHRSYLPWSCSGSREAVGRQMNGVKHFKTQYPKFPIHLYYKKINSRMRTLVISFVTNDSHFQVKGNRGYNLHRSKPVVLKLLWASKLPRLHYLEDSLHNTELGHILELLN